MKISSFSEVLEDFPTFERRIFSSQAWMDGTKNIVVQHRFNKKGELPWFVSIFHHFLFFTFFSPFSILLVSKT